MEEIFNKIGQSTFWFIVTIVGLFLLALFLNGNRFSDIKVDSTTYQGHTMLIYTKGTSVSVCHSPTCKKCFQVYD